MGVSMKLETQYQADLKKKIEKRLPGSMVLKNDANSLTGIPDLLVLHEEFWATLEVKRSAKEDYEPNQEWYLDKMAGMSFAATIYPENEKEILDELQRSFESRRNARVPQPKQASLGKLRRRQA